MVKIITFAGSLRKESINKQLAQYAAKKGEAFDAEIEYVDIANYEMPVFNADLDIPENTKKLHEKFSQAQGFLLASPEYNSSYPGGLKNIIDWLSRIEPDCFEGKVIGIMAASPGPLGGIRMLPQLRTLLSNLHMIVAPTMASVGSVTNIGEDFENKRVIKTISETIELSKKLK